jgi:Flp pilus assembly protein TadG
MLQRLMRRLRRWPGRDDERGAVAVLFTIVLVVVLGFCALLVDLGQARASSRNEQLYVDLAALAAGARLTQADYNGACQAAITNLNTNDPRISPAITASTFCSSVSNTCTNSTTQAAPSTTVGSTTVTIHFPVPSSEITSAYWTGAGLNDGTSQCQRMRVIVRASDTSMFSRIFSSTSLSTSRSATVRPSGSAGSPPALWVLDPTGCVPLKVDGGSQVTVGTSTVQGVITVDSKGTTCSGSSTTVSATGSGTILKSIGPPSGGTTGQLNLVAQPAGVTSCSIPACDPADVSGGRLAPQPQHGDVATRAYLDWRYNCKTSPPTASGSTTAYPIFHSVTIENCPYTAASGGSSYPYIDNLKTAIGSSGSPATGSWTQIGPGGNACSPNASVKYPVGNYYVKCTKGNNGFVVNGGVTVEFSGGNVVFEDNVTVSNGGTLKFNTDNHNSSLSSSCIPPTVQTPCLDSTSWSPNAAIVYIRGDNSTTFSTSGTGTVIANHVFVYGGTGSVAFSGNPPTWTAPTEGPFDSIAGQEGLAYWSDMPPTATNAQLSSFTITGGSGATLTGIFFTPEASPFKLAGGGNWGQQNAQFISYQLTVTGGGTLTLAPNSNYIKIPTPTGYLIR